MTKDEAIKNLSLAGYLVEHINNYLYIRNSYTDIPAKINMRNNMVDDLAIQKLINKATKN